MYEVSISYTQLLQNCPLQWQKYLQYFLLNITKVIAFSNKMVGTSISIESSEKLSYPSISICRNSENELDDEHYPSDRIPDLTSFLSSVDYNSTYQDLDPESTNSLIDLVNRDIYFCDTHTLILNHIYVYI